MANFVIRGKRFAILMIFSTSCTVLGFDKKAPSPFVQTCKISGCSFEKSVDAGKQSSAHELFSAEDQKSLFFHPLSNCALEIAQLRPNLITGSGKILEYNAKTQSLSLKKPFLKLLSELVELKELDPHIFEARNLKELDEILQKPQGRFGGLLRKKGSERWEMTDSPAIAARKTHFAQLFCELGFASKEQIKEPITVDHCIVFEARVKSAERRIEQTLNMLISTVKVADRIFLLSSNRCLDPDEISYLRRKWKTLDSNQSDEWEEIFAQQNQCTESTAMKFLWNTFTAKRPFRELRHRAIFINSSKLHQGEHRITTADTLMDWLEWHNCDQTHFFCLVEQPYRRLADQLSWALLKDKWQGIDHFTKKAQRLRVHCQLESLSPNFSSCVILDEIARNIHLAKSTCEFCESIQKEQ